MRCLNCEFEGEPEFGEFEDEQYKKLLIYHIRCPQCKESRTMIIDSYEALKRAILYPEFCYGFYRKHKKTMKRVDITPKGSWDITCPVCHYGEGGGFLSKDKTEKLIKLMVDKRGGKK